MPATRNEWFCIVNPHAGSGKTVVEWTRAEGLFYKHDIAFRTSLTNYKYHATKLVYDAAVEGFRRIIAIGGDGSIHEIVGGIMRYCNEYSVPSEEFTLAVIPIGSGNDWIKTIGIPHDIDRVVEFIADEEFTQQDIIKVETPQRVSYMVNVGGTGIDALVCDKVNRIKERGTRRRLIYFKALISTLLSIKKFQTIVIADGKRVYEGAALSIALGNGKYSGGGMIQVPDARNNDGLLDYMIVPQISVWQILRELPKLFKGNLNEVGILSHGQCKSLTIAGENIVEVDGEMEGTLPVKVSVTGSRINILKGVVDS